MAAAVGAWYDIGVTLPQFVQKRSQDSVSSADEMIAMAFARAERHNGVVLGEYEAQFTIIAGRLARYAAAPVLAVR